MSKFYIEWADGTAYKNETYESEDDAIAMAHKLMSENGDYANFEIKEHTQMKEYQIVNVQEILVRYEATVLANNAEEALKKAQEEGADFKLVSTTDYDHVGVEAWAAIGNDPEDRTIEDPDGILEHILD